MIDFSELTEQKISEQYKDLPQDLKNVLSSANTTIIIENIAATYGLNKEQSAMLVQLVGLALLKFVNLEEMKKEMKDSIEIDPVLIPLVANAIYQKIFFPVTESLMPTAPAPKLPAVETRGQSQIQQNSISAPEQPDRYREPGAQIAPQTIPPRIVNLRKPPPPIAPQPKPIAPQPKLAPPMILPRPVLPPQAMAPVQKPTPLLQPIAPIAKPAPTAPAKPSFYFAPLPAKPATPPATQPQKLIFKLPLIEASPHELLTPNAPVPKLPSVETKRQSPVQQKETSALGRPQFILRPPGMPPTELPHDILDLRKDKGEF